MIFVKKYLIFPLKEKKIQNLFFISIVESIPEEIAQFGIAPTPPETICNWEWETLWSCVETVQQDIHHLLNNPEPLNVWHTENDCVFWKNTHLVVCGTVSMWVIQNYFPRFQRKFYFNIVETYKD